MSRIRAILLDPATIVPRTPEIAHEQKAAIADLLEENSFALKEGSRGPYDLTVSVIEGRIHLDLMPEEGMTHRLTLPASAFRGIVKDYFLIVESYFEAVKTATLDRIEAIDMGRRGVHNEGSRLIEEMLEDKASLNFETARRLFSLICALHMK